MTELSARSKEVTKLCAFEFVKYSLKTALPTSGALKQVLSKKPTWKEELKVKYVLATVKISISRQIMILLCVDILYNGSVPVLVIRIITCAGADPHTQSTNLGCYTQKMDEVREVEMKVRGYGLRIRFH